MTKVREQTHYPEVFRCRTETILISYSILNFHILDWRIEKNWNQRNFCTNFDSNDNWLLPWVVLNTAIRTFCGEFMVKLILRRSADWSGHKYEVIIATSLSSTLFNSRLNRANFINPGFTIDESACNSELFSVFHYSTNTYIWNIMYCIETLLFDLNCIFLVWCPLERKSDRVIH